MKHSEQIDKLAPALAKAQAALKPAVKDSLNPHFKSHYADLASVWDACKGALEANGLSVLQGFSTEGAQGAIWTTVLHSSGQYITGTCPLVLGKLDPQGVGSATTYYRRYGLAAMLGITQEDDDGNAATQKPPMAPKREDDKALLDHLANIEASATIAELQAAWAKVPANLQAACTKSKDAKKTELAKGSN